MLTIVSVFVVGGGESWNVKYLDVMSLMLSLRAGDPVVRIGLVV